MAKKWKINRQVSIGYKPDGKRLIKWIHANSEREFEVKKKELLINWKEKAPSDITFGEYSEKWFDAFKSNCEYNTQRTNRSALRSAAALNNKKLKNIKRIDIQKIASSLPPQMARLFRKTVKAIFESAIIDGIIVTNPCARIEVPKAEKTDRKPFTDAEKEAVLNAEFEPLVRLYVDVLYYLGLRPGEAKALMWKDFDQESKTVTISRAVEYVGNNAEIKSTKTKVTRTIPVPDVLIGEIRAYNSPNPSLYMFVDKKSNLWSKSIARRIEQRILSTLNKYMGGDENLKAWNHVIYSFRHNRATQLYYLSIRSNGALSFFKCAEYMGHSQKMFLETYSHMMPDVEAEDLLREIV